MQETVPNTPSLSLAQRLKVRNVTQFGEIHQNTSFNISYNMLQNTFKYLIQVPVIVMNTPTLILNLHTNTSTCNLIVCFYNVVQKIRVYIVLKRTVT